MPPPGAAVYMLRCSDGSFYVGSTRGGNLAGRLAQHQAGFGGRYTSVRRPVTLIWSQNFDDYNEAFAAERQIKGWSRAKKEALVAENWDLVRLLARKPKFRE